MMIYGIKLIVTLFLFKVEVDVFGEKLSVSEMKQKQKEAQVLAAEAEFNRLNRRVQELEEDLETTETKFVLASQKLDKAATTADDSDRMKKVLENRAADDEKKLIRLAEELKDAQKMAEDADKKYDDTQKKMGECERSLEVSEERASSGEFKIIELEEELKVVANNLKSLEVSEDKANQRETFYKDEIKRLTAKLKQSETRAEFAERSVGKLQKEVRLTNSQTFFLDSLIHLHLFTVLSLILQIKLLIQNQCWPNWTNNNEIRTFLEIGSD